MADITTRETSGGGATVKGSPLTNTEVDTNFINLNTDKVESGGDATLADVTVDSLQFTGGTGTQGTVSWNVDEETLDVILDGATLQMGQEVHYHVRNNTASTISNGTPVMVTGTIGASGRLTIAPMDATNQDNGIYYIGVTTEDIAADADGKATHFGKIRGLDTSAYADGDVLWLSTSTVGAFTATEPSTGIKIPAAIVINSHASTGTLFCRYQGAYGIHDMHDFDASVTPVDNDVVAYDATSGTYQPQSAAEAGLATAAQGSLADTALQTETDTLDSVTGRGATTTNAITVGNLTSTGIDDNATSTAITIDSSENVGIGETNPATTLEVKATNIEPLRLTKAGLGGPNLEFANDDGVIAEIQSLTSKSLVLTADPSNDKPNSYMGFEVDGSERLRIDTSGRVGINEESPDTQLHITAVDNALITLESTDTTLTNGQVLGGIQMKQNDASYASTDGGYIKFVSDQLYGGTRINFGTSDTFFSGDSQAMTITGTQKVGVGIDNPYGKLHIASNVNTPTITPTTIADELVIENQGACGMSFLSPNTSKQSIFFGDSDDVDAGGIQYDHNVPAMYFREEGSTAMTIKGGNVGIGTDSPDFPLSVSGDAQIENTSAGILRLKRNDTVTTTGNGIGQIQAISNHGGSNFTAAMIRFEVGDTVGTDGEILLETSGTERFRVDSSGKIGIGESNPDSELHISSGSPDLILEDTNSSSAIGSSNRVRFRNNTGTYSAQIGNDPSIDGGQNFTLGTLVGYPVGIMANGSTRLIVSSSGNVGIGEANPDTGNLVVATGSRTLGGTITARNSFDGTGWISGDRIGRLAFDAEDGSQDYTGTIESVVSQGGNFPYRTDLVFTSQINADRQEILRLTGDRKVIISSTAPQLSLKDTNNGNGGGTTGHIRFESSDGNATTYIGVPQTTANHLYISTATNGGAGYVTGSTVSSHVITESRDNIIWRTGNQTSTNNMTLDANGALLVGTTSTGFSAEGHVFRAGDYASHTVDGDVVMLLNRTASDGGIVQFRKDGTNVGSIGVTGIEFYIDGAYNVNRSGLELGYQAISPRLGQGSANGTVNLGTSGRRFKDLHLSGGAYLGGTAASNKLDDYEEGTWTPVLNASGGGSFTYIARHGFYTKVGNIVHLTFWIQLSAPSSVSGNASIIGIPFAVNGSARPTAALRFNSLPATANKYIMNYAAGSTINLQYASGDYQSGTVVNVPVTWFGNGDEIGGTITYKA